MTKKPAPTPARLKVKVPLAFEAEGEGLIPIICVATLCALVVVLAFVGLRLL